MNARMLHLITTAWTFALVLGTGASVSAGVRKIRTPATFPYVISQPGTYILDENLVLPDANTSAIEIQSDNVTIDLNGFTIKGPVVCTPTTCAGVSTAHGITATAYDNIRVMNGTVRGMLDGVRLTGRMERVEGVTAVSNVGRGIYIGSGIVSDCIAALNFDQGIRASEDDSRVRGSIAIDNRQEGIYVGRAIVTDSIAVNNRGGDGIGDNGSGLGHFTGNVANDNYDAGLYGQYRIALGNVAIDNELGLDCFGCAYGFNYFTGNNSGDVSFSSFDSSVEVGTNACGGDTSCP